MAQKAVIGSGIIFLVTFTMLAMSLVFSSAVWARSTVVLAASYACPYVCDSSAGKGYFIDVVEAAYKRNNIRVVWKYVPFKRALFMADNAMVDGVAGVTRRQNIKLIFSDESIGHRRYDMYVRGDDSWQFTGLNSLYIRKIGVLGGVSYGIMDAFLRRYSSGETDSIHTLVGSNGHNRLIRLLVSGRVNMIVADSNVIDSSLSQAEREAISLSGRLPREGVFLGFGSPDGAKLSELFSNGLGELRRSGELDQILSRYGLKDWISQGEPEESPFGKDYLYKMERMYKNTKGSSAGNIKTDVIIFQAAVQEDSGYWEYAKKFKSLVELYSKNEMKVRLDFLNISEHDLVMNIAEHQVHMGMVATNNVAPYSPSLGVLILPYMFPSIDSAQKLFSHPVMNEIAERAALESGVRPIGFFIGGYRLLASREKPVRRVADMKSLKIRVPNNQIMVEAFRSWAVEPYPLPWNELYPALEGGWIDGMENPLNIMMAGVNMKKPLWESVRHITNIRYQLFSAPHLISETFYSRLTEREQSIILRAVREAEGYIIDKMKDEERKLVALLKKNGVMFYDPVDERDDWSAKAKSVWSSLNFRAGGDQLVKKVHQVVNGDSVDKGL